MLYSTECNVLITNLYTFTDVDAISELICGTNHGICGTKSNLNMGLVRQCVWQSEHVVSPFWRSESLLQKGETTCSLCLTVAPNPCLNYFWSRIFRGQFHRLVRGGGGSPLYKLYRYVPSHRLRFLCRFGLKTSIHFAHFGLELGMVFSELRKCMNVFIVSIPNE